MAASTLPTLFLLHHLDALPTPQPQGVTDFFLSLFIKNKSHGYRSPQIGSRWSPSRESVVALLKCCYVTQQQRHQQQQNHKANPKRNECKNEDWKGAPGGSKITYSINKANLILNQETHSPFISIAHSHVVVRNKSFRSGQDGERTAVASEDATLYSHSGSQALLGPEWKGSWKRSPLSRFLPRVGPVYPLRSDALEFKGGARRYLQWETQPSPAGDRRAGGCIYNGRVLMACSSLWAATAAGIYRKEQHGLRARGRGQAGARATAEA